MIAEGEKNFGYCLLELFRGKQKNVSHRIAE